MTGCKSCTWQVAWNTAGVRHLVERFGMLTSWLAMTGCGWRGLCLLLAFGTMLLLLRVCTSCHIRQDALDLDTFQKVLLMRLASVKTVIPEEGVYLVSKALSPGLDSSKGELTQR